VAAANILPTPLTDGIPYATGVPLVTTEADLGDGLKTPRPIAVVEGQTVVAVVQLTTQGHVSGNNSYVFMQTDLGDGNWIDVAWCQFTKTDQYAPALFVLCGGGLGAMNNAFGPQRQPGSAPSAQGSGSNAVPLGGRVRFTGFGTSSGGSSSLAGTYSGTFATITYRLQAPR
jgi:hypothetical protein